MSSGGAASGHAGSGGAGSGSGATGWCHAGSGSGATGSVPRGRSGSGATGSGGQRVRGHAGSGSGGSGSGGHGLGRSGGAGSGSGATGWCHAGSGATGSGSGGHGLVPRGLGLGRRSCGGPVIRARPLDVLARGRRRLRLGQVLAGPLQVGTLLVSQRSTPSSGHGQRKTAPGRQSMGLKTEPVAAWGEWALRRPRTDTNDGCRRRPGSQALPFGAMIGTNDARTRGIVSRGR